MTTTTVPRVVLDGCPVVSVPAEELLAAQAVSAGERVLARHRNSTGYISAIR